MRSILVVICILLCSFQERVFALTKYTPPTREEVIRAAKPCKQGGDKKPINDKYICPKGDFGNNTNQTLSDERIECAVQIALSLYAIDQIANTWIKQLQDSREKDSTKWQATINKGVLDGENALSKQYLSVCERSSYDISRFTSSTDTSIPYGCARTTDAFPLTECTTIAQKKSRMWESAGEIIAATNVPKSFQNDKDTFMGKIKDNYEKILDKQYRYKLMVGNAVSKFSAYIEQAVK